MKNLHPENSRQKERGSVLFYILIGVVLFAALSYTVSGMMRGGDATMINEERSKLLAGEILDYARTMKQAAQQMRISNGCDDDSIRFINNQTAGYGASVDTACDLFVTTGGDTNYITPNNDYGSGTEWIFTGDNDVAGVGSTAPDLIMVLQNLNTAICNEINNQTGVAAITNDTDGVSYTKFTGTYTASETVDIVGEFRAGCVNDTTTGGNNIFYQVLLTR